jgi:hypothetical protein
MALRSTRRKSRSTATPRFGWSGVGELITPTISDGDMAGIVESLPDCRSTPEEIKSKIQALGARYHRYLHQDEFGPTRAERMSALRAMQTCVELLDSLIVNLPPHLALELTTTEPDQSLSFRILRSWTILRGWTMEQIHQAASTELAFRHSLYSADDLYLLEEICKRAGAAIEVVRPLDTSTEAELFADAVRTGVLFKSNIFSITGAPLSALKAQVDLTLERLRKQGGPQRQVSLWWLVREACDLWTRETGQLVTNSASRNGKYVSAPESPAGRFVLAVVETLQPSQFWIAQHPREDAAVRAWKFAASPADRARTIYFAMRKYVADHPRPGVRRGRPKGGAATL